LDIVRTDRR